MISEVVMPQMGADMTEGTIVRWLKKEGDNVDRGEIIAEIETDKANVEIEAFESGVFRRVLAEEGATIAVGTAIAVIASADEDLSRYQGAPPAGAKTEAKAAAATQSVETPARAATTAPSRTNGRMRASPVARKLAAELGVDLAQVSGSGPDGRIVRRDVEAAAGRAGAAKPAAEAARPPAAPPKAVSMSKMRQTIARRMAQSKREAPHYYVTVDIDMAEAERVRHQINDTHHRELHISVNDLIVKACALALQRHPMFNTWLIDGEVQQHGAINVCIAIALDDGLIAPAVLDCQDKSLAEISRDTRSLVERAKSGALKQEEYAGGTFTVSNLGMFDVETLVAIIQPPQTAILGVGAVREAAVVRDGHVAAGQLMKTALSADHRVTDGAQGAQFLNEVRTLLENPLGLLV